MRISNDVKTISSSLSFLGLDGMAGRMESDIRQTASTADTTGVIAASFSMYACEVKATRAARCLKRSRLPEEILFSDFLMVDDRSLSQLTIAELQELNFMQEHRPLVIEGKPGVGKSWLGMAIAKRACDECHRVRWTIFSELLAELGSLRIIDAKDGSRRYMKKVRFYTNFDLLCIDEFLNAPMKDSDVFILQDVFDSLYRKRKSFLICTQCDVARLPEMIANTSMGAALRGRILERAKVVSITGPDLRLLDKPLPSSDEG